jgi:predicted homoserine dehydrogenase-like protein
MYLLGFKEKLNGLVKQGKRINVGVVGAGQMGLSIISHLSSIKGFRVCAVADKSMSRLGNICGSLGLNRSDIFEAQNSYNGSILNANLKDILAGKKISDFSFKQTSEAILSGRIVFTNDFTLLAEIPEIDIVVDATGYTDIGAGVALTALLGNKDVVTLNVETDITVGPILKKIADDRKLVYTLAAGDEPAVLMELFDFADGLGFKIICAGKGKNNPLDRHANPASLEEYASKRGSSGKMMTSFVDGTKSMIEMACLSNATGLIPDCRGMHSPKAKIAELLSVFCLTSEGGILEKEGVVDFVIGDLAPGVFLVFSTQNKLTKELLNYLLMGEGPNYLLYRPYHIPGIETPLSIAKAYFERKPWIVPARGLVSEVITVAKKSLKSGEKIDGIGGYSVYGLIDRYEVAAREKLLPVGLSNDCVLKNNKSADEPVLIDDVEFDPAALLVQLRKLQDDTIQSNKKEV